MHRFYPHVDVTSFNMHMFVLSRGIKRGKTISPRRVLALQGIFWAGRGYLGRSPCHDISNVCDSDPDISLARIGPGV